MAASLELVAAPRMVLRPPPVARSRAHGFVKSPLRYPGGKTRAVSTILDMLPRNLDVLASPFFGGGSIELAAASRGIRVHGYDAFKPLVLFWQHLLDAPKQLARAVKKRHPLSRSDFYELQSIMKDGNFNDADTAAIFFVLNRASFSGITLSGGMSPGHPRFTPSAIERLEQFSVAGLSVKLMDFAKSITRHKKHFLYCDPPYANGEALYGNKGDCHLDFDHEKLAEILTSRDRWILSYNDCPLVRDMYTGFPIVGIEWTYGMNNDKKSNEIVILSNDLAYLAHQ